MKNLIKEYLKLKLEMLEREEEKESTEKETLNLSILANKIARGISGNKALIEFIKASREKIPKEAMQKGTVKNSRPCIVKLGKTALKSRTADGEGLKAETVEEVAKIATKAVDKLTANKNKRKEVKGKVLENIYKSFVISKEGHEKLVEVIKEETGLQVKFEDSK